MEVLREKHPVMRILDFTDPECSSFEEYKQDPDVISLKILEYELQWVASKLSGAAGPNETGALSFQSWLLCFGLASTSLRKELVK